MESTLINLRGLGLLNFTSLLAVLVSVSGGYQGRCRTRELTPRVTFTPPPLICQRGIEGVYQKRKEKMINKCEK